MKRPETLLVSTPHGPPDWSWLYMMASLSQHPWVQQLVREAQRREERELKDLRYLRFHLIFLLRTRIRLLQLDEVKMR